MQAILEGGGCHASRGVVAGEDTTTDAGEHTEYHQDGDEDHQPDHLREDEEVGGVDTHDLHGVDLLRHPHGADLGGDVAAYLSGEDEGHDGAGELQQDNLTGRITNREFRDQRRADVQGDLDGDNRSDKDGDDNHDPE